MSSLDPPQPPAGCSSPRPARRASTWWAATSTSRYRVVSPGPRPAPSAVFADHLLVPFMQFRTVGHKPLLFHLDAVAHHGLVVRLVFSTAFHVRPRPASLALKNPGLWRPVTCNVAMCPPLGVQGDTLKPSLPHRSVAFRLDPSALGLGSCAGPLPQRPLHRLEGAPSSVRLGRTKGTPTTRTEHSLAAARPAAFARTWWSAAPGPPACSWNPTRFRASCNSISPRSDQRRVQR